MGWSFMSRAAGTSSEDFFKREFGEKFSAGIKASATKNGVFYAAYETEGSPDDIFVPDANGKVCTCLVVLLKWAPNARDGYNFGYKDMTETMGPNEADCPKRLLDMLSPIKPEAIAKGEGGAKWASEWRAKCRAAIERRAKAIKLVDGKKVKLESPLSFGGTMLAEFTVEKRGKRTLFRANNGMLCRIPRRCLPELRERA